MDEREMSAVDRIAEPIDTAGERVEAADSENISVSGEDADANVEACPEKAESEPAEIPDYSEIIESDLRALRAAYPELSKIQSITELENPLRYAELRDLGLTPKEAYLATSGGRRRADNRAHLFSAVPKGAGSPTSNMSHAELAGARELFPGLGDAELHGLYKKVTV